MAEETARPVSSSLSNEKSNEKVAYANDNVEITTDVDNGEIFDESGKKTPPGSFLDAS